jgi:hypothetical protein
MDMQTLQAGRIDRDIGLPVVTVKMISRDQLIIQLMAAAGTPHLQSGLRALTDYVGATHYLLARCDLIQESGLDFVVASNWPFDLVRRLASELVGAYVRTTELEKCMQLLQPNFALLPDDVDLQEQAGNIVRSPSMSGGPGCR